MSLWERIRRRLRPPRRLSFTREGRIIVILAVAVGFAAINTGNNLLYLLLGWLLSFIIASGILSEMTLKKLTVERRPPPRLWANEPFLMEVVIKNGKAKRSSFSIEVEDRIGRTPLDKRCYFLKIPEGKSQRTSYRHTFGKRGLYTLTGYRIATKFPFALFRKSRDVDAPLEVIVYPARVAVPRPPPRARTSAATRTRTGSAGAASSSGCARAARATTAATSTGSRARAPAACSCASTRTSSRGASSSASTTRSPPTCATRSPTAR